MSVSILINKKDYKDPVSANRWEALAGISFILLSVLVLGLIPLPSRSLTGHIYEPVLPQELWIVVIMLLISFALAEIKRREIKITKSGKLYLSESKLIITFDSDILLEPEDIRFIELTDNRNLYVKTKESSFDFDIAKKQNLGVLTEYLNSLQDQCKVELRD